MKENEFLPAVKHAVVTTGEAIRILRKLKLLSQKELAAKSGVSVKTISFLENNKIDIGRKRAGIMAKAFGIHPSVIYSEYEAEVGKGLPFSASVPNKTTIETFEKSKRDEELVYCDSAEDCQKLGI